MKPLYSFQKILPVYVLILLLALSNGINAQVLQATQTIRGSLVDQESKQPLLGATVIVIGIEGKGAVVDANGEFIIKNIPVGRRSLKLSYMGYETLLVPDIMLSAGKEVVLKLSMVEMVQTMKEFTVSYDRKQDRNVTNNEMAVVSSRSFNPDDTKKFAGALGDPSRMAANFAGVISGNDSRNDIVVRGNSPNAMLWQMEGVNIPNPNHFGASFNTGGPVSMLNANNIAKSDFFTSAFPAQYGNANGGVFDVMLRDGNNQQREFVGQIGFNGLELGAEGPLSKGSKASYVVNYRYSTLAFMQNLGVDVGTGGATPLYQDINFKITAPTKSKGKFSVWGMGGSSSIDLLGADVDTTAVNFYGARDENTLPRYKSGVIAASFEQSLNPKTWAKFTLAASGSKNYYSVDSIDLVNDAAYRKGEGSFTDIKYSAVLNLTHKVNTKNAIHAGFSHDLTNFNYFNKDVYNQGSVDTVRVDSKGAHQLTQGYVQWKHRFNARLSANVGLHSQFFSTNQQFVLEPRAGLRYAINEKQSLNVGYGLHHQNMPTYNMFVRNAQGEETNKKVKFSRSNHLVLGYDYSINAQWKLKLETYMQRLDKVPVNSYPSSFSMLNIGADFVPSDQSNLVNKGTGTNYGLELTLERYFNKGYYVLVSSSVFESKYKGSDYVQNNTAFNTNYALNVLTGKEYAIGKKGDVLYGNFKLTTVGGRYFTPLDLAASEASGYAVYDESKPFSEKQDAYFRVDLKLGWRRDLKKSSLEFAIDLQNVTNHQNIFAQGYNKYTNSITYEYQLGFFPVPMFRYTF